MKLSKKNLGKFMVLPLTGALILGCTGCSHILDGNKLSEEEMEELKEKVYEENEKRVSDEINHAIVSMGDVTIDYEVVKYSTSNYEGDATKYTLYLSDGSTVMVPVDHTILFNDQSEYNAELIEDDGKQKEMTR